MIYDQTTRRRALGDCPDVLLSPAACGVSVLGRNTPLAVFLALVAYPASSLICRLYGDMGVTFRV